MTYDDASKIYVSNRKDTIVCSSCIASLVQKLFSTIFFIVLCRSCLLYIVGFSCNCNNSDATSAADITPSRHHVTQPHCLGTVTTLGTNDPIGYIIEERRLLDPKSKWKQDQLKSTPKVIFHLHDQESIALPDGAVPNWQAYGIAPFMFCQIKSLGDKHIVALDLNGAKFQNGEQLGFIFVKNNRTLVDVMQHLIGCPDQSYACRQIKDGLILPGVVSGYLLQSESILNRSIDLNSYSNGYCYIKKGDHYCFIPLKNSVPEVKLVQPVAGSSYNSILPTNIQPSLLENRIDAPPVRPLFLKNDAPSAALSMVHEEAVTDRSMQTNDIESAPLNLLGGVGGGLYSDKAAHNNGLSEAMRAEKIIQMKQKALNKIVKKIATYTIIHEQVIKTIQKINLDKVVLNDIVQNHFKPNVGSTLQLVFNPVLQAISQLQAALILEKSCQLGIEYSRPTYLSDQCSALIKQLRNLEVAICEEYFEILSTEILLHQVIEFFESMYDLLLYIRRLYILNPTDRMRQCVKQLYIEDDRQSKTAQVIIEQLEKLEDEQLSMVREVRKIASKRAGTLVAIQDAVTLVRNPLENAIHTIRALDLRIKLRLNLNVIVGKVKNLKRLKEIIADLDLAKEYICAIRVRVHDPTLKILKAAIAKQIQTATNEALKLANKLETNLRSKTNSMVDQEKVLKTLLPTIDACDDAGYEAA
ncbi:hypothetical protein [Cardinium endosymbiont of Sogatella furcifera]|uniref:hypothetical protein n=1 Tax=Cardinium endosymbiont of Sogatella furcifera TaxID=650378 RepID=UPI000E0D4AC4|nr:hypothetical protein [Cardinium endosymbiont of Sogatella furcifera]